MNMVNAYGGIRSILVVVHTTRFVYGQDLT